MPVVKDVETSMSARPGQVRDAIVDYLGGLGHPANPADIHLAVIELLPGTPPSSVRSSLQKNCGSLFERSERGSYTLRALPSIEKESFGIGEARSLYNAPAEIVYQFGRQTLILNDCLDWLREAEENSIHAVVTDPPYGLREYEVAQQKKMRAGRGGVWRLPPSFDGANRKPLPRFTVLTPGDRKAISEFFLKWGALLIRVLRPGGHVFIAGNPLLTPLVANALDRTGFERRGEIVRLVRTFRGGDRPKGAEDDYPDVSTMPRSCWEPWGLYRKPLGESTVAKNLEKWGTGALRRPSERSPFLDVIESGILPERERKLAPHPSAKPQQFMRQLVQASLPMGTGTVLDPFAGCATTLAACEALGIAGIGVEVDPIYWHMAIEAIPSLASLDFNGVPSGVE